MSEPWKKKYRWKRTWDDETGINGKRHEDYVGYDTDEYIGRIFYEISGPTKGLWRWAGGRPKGLRARPIMPNAGYMPTHAEAARTVEEYWDAMRGMIT